MSLKTIAKPPNDRNTSIERLRELKTSNRRVLILASPSLWSHILIDVFTHSADFYPSPVFYPVTYWGFDGLAWNSQWFMVTNYLAILIFAAITWHRRSTR